MSRQRGLTLILVLCAVIFLGNAARFTGLQLDDTFISFRYARNLVEGNGLVFNPGERVEGYTNFLFVFFAAAFLKLGINPLAGTEALSFASAIAAIYLTDALDRRPGGRAGVPRGFPLAAALLAALEPFSYWAVVSMETLLFASLLAGALLVQHREMLRGRGRSSALLFVALSLTRPEGSLCFAVAWTAGLLIERARRRSWVHAGRYVATAILYAALFGSYLVWRFWYYGAVLPNTYRAKVTWGAGQLVTGLAYGWDWAIHFPLLALALLAPLALIRRIEGDHAAQPSPLALVYAVASSYIAYVVLVGGDHMPFFRFAILVTPLLCLLAAAAIRRLMAAGPIPRPLAASVLGLLVVVHAAAPYFSIQPYRAFVAHRTAVVGTAVGKYLRKILRPGDLIAVNTAGTIPYASGLPTLDMLGLTDKAIASRPVYVISEGWSGHRRGWGAYVMRRRPRVILWYNSAGSADPFYLGDRELADNPFFRFFYALRVAKLPPLGGDRSRVIGRFAGYPFGSDPSGKLYSGDLGLEAYLKTSPVPHTAFRDAPIVVRYFETDPRDAPLWDLATGHRQDPGGFVDAVAALWRRNEPATVPFDSQARRRVEALCAEAYAAVKDGRAAEAKKILTEAAALNGKARSPLVYQYIANVAVESGNLLAAVPAEKEALRLAPGDDLYAKNLKSLLSRPFSSFAKPARNTSSGE